MMDAVADQVSDTKELKRLSKTDYAIAGGLSGCITRLLCQPLDVLKIRFQLQVEPISKTSVAKYRSVTQAVTLMIQEEGLKSLWKGHVSGQLLSISFGVSQFMTFESLKQYSQNFKLSSTWTPAVNFVCGAAAGSVATLVSFPFDVIRTRLVAQSEKKKLYYGNIHALIRIYKTEGFFVLYRGLWPTVLQTVPHTGMQFMCYKLFNDICKNFGTVQETTVTTSLIAGSLAGLCAKTTVYPFDLIKKRLQIQGFEDNRRDFGVVFKCTNLKDCIVKIYRKEGLLGYFKGLNPSLIKSVSTTALHFSCYEMICKFLQHQTFS